MEAHFVWLRVHNQTDRMSQGQELWSHFKRLVIGVPRAFKTRLKVEEKTASVMWINQHQNPWAKNLRGGESWEASQPLQEPWWQGQGNREGTNLKRHASIFCSTRKGLYTNCTAYLSPLKRPLPTPSEGARLWLLQG